MTESENVDIPEPTEDEQNWIKILRNKAKERDQFAQELAGVKQRDAIRDAGLDPNNKLHKLLIDSYKGEWQPDSLKQAATEYGLFEDQGKPKEPTPEELAERASHERINSSSAGSAPGDGANEQKPWLEADNPDDFMATYKGRVWTGG